MVCGVIGIEGDNQQPLNMENGAFYFKVGGVFVLAILAMLSTGIASGQAHFEPQEPRYH